MNSGNAAKKRLAEGVALSLGRKLARIARAFTRIDSTAYSGDPRVVRQEYSHENRKPNRHDKIEAAAPCLASRPSS